jgi:excisionase family DNA binding protein
MTETLLNYKEAAEYLGCKVDTLQRWSARHDIERIKYDNGQVKFKPEFLNDYIERCREPSRWQRK